MWSCTLNRPDQGIWHLLAVTTSKSFESSGRNGLGVPHQVVKYSPEKYDLRPLALSLNIVNTCKCFVYIHKIERN